jgi:hypothetical protein
MHVRPLPFDYAVLLDPRLDPSIDPRLDPGDRQRRGRGRPNGTRVRRPSKPNEG